MELMELHWIRANGEAWVERCKYIGIYAYKQAHIQTSRDANRLVELAAHMKLTVSAGRTSYQHQAVLEPNDNMMKLN